MNASEDSVGSDKKKFSFNSLQKQLRLSYKIVKKDLLYVCRNNNKILCVYVYISLFLNMCNIDPIQFLTSNTLNLNGLFIQRCQNDYFIIFL